MATLKSIRKRISSVKSTQKITKAMKMVSAAKLRRAQSAVESSRPYADCLKKVIVTLAEGGELSHPLFKVRENPKKLNVLVFTSNRGLCGGFNSNLLRQVERYLAKSDTHYETIDVRVIGKKGRDFYKSKKRNLKDVMIEYADLFPFEDAEKLTKEMIDGYISGECDEYIIVYNKFVSALTQEVTFESVVPFSVEKLKDDEVKKEDLTKEKMLIDFIYEPSKEKLLDYVVPKYIATRLYQAHLESVASELGARMTAMESATKNASEMIDKLTLQYNRARQAAITTELMDIVNGAEAIK